MNHIISLLLIALMLLSCTALAKSDAPASETDPSLPAAETAAARRKLIIDTDAGADDITAILIAALDPNAEILGITTIAGNVSLDQAVDNALMALEIGGIDAPVYAGAATPLSGVEREAFSVFGEDGMGDCGLIHPKKQGHDGDAVEFILDTIRRNPGQVEIVALGPVTNLARAIEREPETMRQVKRIWSMASAGIGPGNVTPVAEFNVYKDVAAYKLLLDAALPVTIIGLDICNQPDAMLTRAIAEQMLNEGPRSQFVSQAFAKLMAMNLKNSGIDHCNLCDPMAMACTLWPDFACESVPCDAYCIDSENEAFGQVIFFRSDRTYESSIPLREPTTTLVTRVQVERFLPRLREILQQP